jgi:hypothetical protein
MSQPSAKLDLKFQQSRKMASRASFKLTKITFDLQNKVFSPLPVIFFQFNILTSQFFLFFLIVKETFWHIF